MPDPLDDREVDERFADIVEQWRAQAGDEDLARAQPPALAEGGDPTEDERVPDEDSAAAAIPEPPPDLAIRLDPAWRRSAEQPTWDEVLDAEQAEGYVPPDPELPPGEDLHYWGALIGLVVGPLIVIWVAIASPSSSTWWLLTGIGMAVAGFILLIMRMPTHRDPSDDDNGARV